MADPFDAFPIAKPLGTPGAPPVAAAAPSDAADPFGAYPLAPEQPSAAAPVREASGVLDSLRAGFQASAPGLAWRGKLPDLVINPEHASWWERALGGVAQVGSELPLMIGGAIAGAPAGAAIGTAVAPGAGTAAGALLGAGAGMGAVPAAIRETLIQAYKSGDIKTAGDFWNAVREVATTTAKEASINAIGMGAGGIAARAAGKALVPAIGTAISVPTATATIEGADIAAQIAAMATIPAAMQGRLPDAQEILDAAILMGGMKAAHVAAARITDTFIKTGKTPAEQVADAQADPTIAEDLTKAPEQPFNAFTPEVEAAPTRPQPMLRIQENLFRETDRLNEINSRPEVSLTDADKLARDAARENITALEKELEHARVIEDGGQRIYDDVRRQVKAADEARQASGLTPLGDDHADAVAALVKARVVTRAARLGLTPEEVYNERPVQIQDETAPEVAAAEAAIPEGAPRFEPPEVDMFGDPIPVSNAPRYGVEGLATQEVPLENLVLSKEVPQFKKDANAKGVIMPLGGTFDRTGVGPIQVWERKDGTMEVISGRHRFDLAQRSGETTIPAQIHREADGFTARQAATLDAQLNIREEQGSVADYVQYFIDSEISKDTANELGLLARAKGRAGFAISRDGSGDLIAAHRAGVLSDEAALSISATAPGSERLQALGIAMVNDGKSILFATNMMRSVDLMAKERELAGEQGDIFGFDDSAMKEAETMAKRALSRQRQISEQISAVSGAAKRPELARRMGVNVDDPAAIQMRIIELRQEQFLWDNWPMHPELVAKLREEPLKQGAADETQMAVLDIEDAWNRFDDTGEFTDMDLVNEIEGILDSQSVPNAASLEEAVRVWRDEKQFDNEVGGRGDMDQANDAFSSAVRQYLESNREGVKPEYDLKAETPAEARARDEEAAAAAKRKVAEEAAALKGPKVTVDQADLFNTQGTLFQSKVPGMEAFREWSNNAPFLSAAAADVHEFKTGQKIVVEAYHGTSRPDRVGEKFLRKRATSGPMAYHTNNPEIASGYAKGKQDTSISYEDTNYPSWFKFKPKGARSFVDIERAWYHLDESTKAKIAEMAPKISHDPEGSGEIVVREDNKSGNGSYDYNLEQTQRGYDKRGNPLKALVEDWLNSGVLFNDEPAFMEVLKIAGFPVKELTYDDPHAQYPFVYKNYIRMQNPLVTSDIPKSVMDALGAAAKKDRSRAQRGGADVWDKNTRTLREWYGELTNPENTSVAYVWTSIPDKVTEVFKSLGYDGIVDTGGKGGGNKHVVYVPFEETQIKSAIGNRGTYDPNNKNILRQTHRGSYDVAENLITIMQGADKSTVVHELGHSWLQEMQIDARRPKVPDQIRADWDILRRELAIGEDGEISRASHEQFARSIERYLAEGVAPSKELQGVFQRFKEWLMDIYRDLRGLNVNINPELRSVMDRMLATDDQIAAARELGVPRAYVPEAMAATAEAIVPPPAERRKIEPGFKAEQASMEPYADELPPGPGEAPDNIHVNYAYINSPMDVKLAMQRMAEIDQANIQKQRGGTEGVKSWAEANAEQAKYVNDILGGNEDTLHLFEPRDPDAPHIDVRLGILKKLAVGAAKDSARLRDVVLSAGHDATVRQQLEYMGSIERARMIQAEFLGERASVARALNALKDSTEGTGEIGRMLEVIGLGDENRLYQADRTPEQEQAFLKAKLDEILLNYKGKTVLDIAKLHKEIGTLKGSFKFTEEVTKATKWEMIVEGWRSGLLSGPVTHTTNLFGTGAFQVMRAPVDALAAVIGMARGASPGMGESDRASMSEAVARLTGWLGGAQEGLKVAAATYRLDDPTGKTEAYRTAIPGRAGEIIRIPLRLMGAEDALVTTMYTRGELRTLAIRQAFDEDMNPGTREFADRVQSLIDSPTEEMKAAAEGAASRMTFNSPLGEKGLALQLFVAKWNLQWMIPFIRTPINIAKELARMSPFAPVVGEWRAAIAKGGVERDRALAELAIGTGIMGVTMAAALAGNISGGGSPDPGKNRGKVGVWQPYSVLIGDKWYEYARIQPTGTLIGLSADIAAVWDHMTDDEKDKIPKMLSAAFAQAVTNQTFLQGITNFVNAMSDPTRFAPRFFQQLAGSMVPNVIGQPTTMADPIVREVNSSLEAIQARIPGFRQDLLPKRDWLGDPMLTKERVGVVLPSRVQQISDDKVRKEAARLDLSLAAPPKKTHIGKGTGKIGDVELTPQEQDTFEKVSGEFAHKILGNIVQAPGYDAIPDLVKRQIFAKVMTASHRIGAVAALPMEKRLAYIQTISEKVAAELQPGDTP